MSEEGAGRDAVAPAAMSAGTMLRSAREQAGMHIGALAVSLKVPVSKLEALEADRIDLLPDAVFARALAASICRTFKVDPAPVLQKFPDQVTPKLQLDARIEQSSFDTPHMGWRVPLLSRLSRPTLVIVAALLLAALAVWLVPSLDFMKAAAPTVPKSVAKGDVPALPPAPQFVTSPTLQAALPASTPIATMSPLSPASPAPTTPAAPAAAREPVAASTSAETNLVLFKARGATWVEVTDGTGVVQVRKTLATGETVGASGPVPLSVVVGRIDSTEVVVRGKAFDLASVGKDNVARFKIQ